VLAFRGPRGVPPQSLMGGIPRLAAKNIDSTSPSFARLAKPADNHFAMRSLVSDLDFDKIAQFLDPNHFQFVGEAFNLPINLFHAPVKVIPFRLLLLGPWTDNADFACPHVDVDVVGMRDGLRTGYSERFWRSSSLPK
jgi:hypothetical protein